MYRHLTKIEQDWARSSFARQFARLEKRHPGRTAENEWQAVSFGYHYAASNVIGAATLVTLAGVLLIGFSKGGLALIVPGAAIVALGVMFLVAAGRRRLQIHRFLKGYKKLRGN